VTYLVANTRHDGEVVKEKGYGDSITKGRLKSAHDRTGPSILIVLMGSLGDVARGLCVVSPIKGRFSQSKVAWLVEPKCKDLVSLHPQIDEVLLFDRPKGLLAVPELYKELRKERFDVVLDLQRHFKSGLFSFLSGGRRRIGFHPRDAKELNWVFNSEKIPCYGDSLPKHRHYLKFLNHLGVETPRLLDFGLSGVDLGLYLPGVVAALKRPFVVFVMGSAWPSKDWTSEGFFHLTEAVLRSGKTRVVLVGEKGQRRRSQRLCTQFPGKALIDLVGETSLRQLLAVIQAADAAVGPDSGPGHLAAAVGTPYVALFGPTSARRTAPYNNEHLVVRADVGCAPCYKRTCPLRDTLCMQGIGVDDVLKKLSQAITGYKTADFFG
jgi:ADP-heptose:LPS heptosyltransferase